MLSLLHTDCLEGLQYILRILLCDIISWTDYINTFNFVHKDYMSIGTL